jgi:coproporphyrinogen III oxidase
MYEMLMAIDDHFDLPIAAESGNVPFFACGISLVIHAHNPHVPTAHANYRHVKRSHWMLTAGFPHALL